MPDALYEVEILPVNDGLMIAKIITAPAKLICNRLIYTTSLQVADDLF